MTFVSDIFTDTGNTALQSHTPDQGGPWVRHPNSAAFNLAITAAGTKVRIANTGVSQIIIYYITGAPASAEYDVTADFILMGAPTGDSSGITGRTSTSATTMYLARYDLANTRWQLAKIVAGTLTDLGTFTQTLTPGQAYAVKLQIRDAAKKVFVDGVERITSADNAITSAGTAGFRAFTGSTPSDAASLQWDNFAAADPVATPGNTVVPVVSGTRVVGETLTSTTGTWTGSPTGYSYNWCRDNVTVGATDQNTYVAQSADIGHTVICKVTASNGSGAGSPATSNGLAIVAEAVASDLQFRLAAAGGLGGSPGTQITTPTAMWDPVTFSEADNGDTEYRAGYMKWTHEVRSLSATVLWINTQTTSPTTSIAIAVAAEAAGSDVTAIPDEETPPVGPTFSAPVDEGSGIAIGTLAPGQARGFWQKRIVLADTAELDVDGCQLAWSGIPS